MIVRRNDLVVFLVVAFGLSWLFALWPWIGNEKAPSVFVSSAAVWMMLTPTLAVLALWWYRRRSMPELVAETGSRLGSRPRRTVWLIVAAWFGTAAFVWLAFGVSVLLGMNEFDFSLGVDWTVLIILEALVGSTLATLPLALGEELGWRGWLQPQLTGRFGVAFGLVATGVIWGLWHLPLTLRGYNYPELGAWAAAAFVVTCVFFGLVLGWLRMRSGSVWPCVVAHAAWNAHAIGVSAFGSLDEKPNQLLSGHGGVVGWVLLALLAAILFLLFPVRGNDHTDPNAPAIQEPASPAPTAS